MENINGGKNPYENLTKSSFENATVISNESEANNINLSQPIYRVVTWNFTDDLGNQKSFQRVLDTRYLFKPSEFWNINTQLQLPENTFVEDVNYGQEVDKQEFLLDQSLVYKYKVNYLLNWDNKSIH